MKKAVVSLAINKDNLDPTTKYLYAFVLAYAYAPIVAVGLVLIGGCR